LIKSLTKKTKQINDDLNKGQEKWHDIKAYLRNNKSLLYLTPTAFFIILMFLVFTHGVIVNNNIGFEVLQINKVQPFGSYNVTVTGISFNPDTGLHRMDLFFDTTAHHVDLFNYQLEANAVALIDPSQSLDVEVVRVTSQFFIIYIKDLPLNFGAIRKDISYFTETNRSTSMSIRTEQSQSFIDEELFFETERVVLMSYALYNDIRIINMNIAEIEVEIINLEEEIATNLSHIQQLEYDMVFQVGDILASSHTRIEAFLNRNANLENNIRERKIEIYEARNHIELIIETINSL